MWTKSRHNKNALRLMRQIEESEISYRDGRIPRIRHKSYTGVLDDLRWWDLPPRSGASDKSWKKFRKNQYKAL